MHGARRMQSSLFELLSRSSCSQVKYTSTRVQNSFFRIIKTTLKQKQAILSFVMMMANERIACLMLIVTRDNHLQQLSLFSYNFERNFN